jgi:PAS domain S-box-containing protein
LLYLKADNIRMSHQDDFISFFGEGRPINSEPEYEAYREKIIAAERVSSGIKALVILLNGVIYFILNAVHYFKPDDVETRPVLAYTVLAISFLYSGLTYLVKPGEKYPEMLASYFSYISDIVFISLWLYATGGYASPFYIMWYVAIVSVALRFNWQIVWVTSVIYIVSYICLLLVLSHVHTAAQFAELAMRCIYIAAIGQLASLISKESYEHNKEKVQIRNMTRSLLNAQNELQERTEELERVKLLLEDKVTERTRDMAANSRNFGLLLDSINLLTWTTTPEGHVNYYNKAWDEFFKGKVDGNHLSEFVHPEEIDDVRGKWRKAKDSGMAEEGKFRWKKHDGSWVPMQVNINCLRDEDGEIIMWVGTAKELNS